MTVPQCRRQPRMGYLRWKFGFRRELRQRQRRRYVSARFPLCNRQCTRQADVWDGGPYPPKDQDVYWFWVPAWARSKRKIWCISTEDPYWIGVLYRRYARSGRPWRDVYPPSFIVRPRW